MDKFQKFMEKTLMPAAQKLNANRYLQAIRLAFLGISAFMIIGSIFLLISSFPSDAYQNFMTSTFGENWSYFVEIPFNAAYSFMALFISFLAAYNLAAYYKVDGVQAGVLSTVCFIIFTPLTDYSQIIPLLSEDQASTLVSALPLTWLGTTGLFTAILCAFFTTEVFRLFVQKDIRIKMPEQVPPEVANSFTTILPGFVIMISSLAIRMFFELCTKFGSIHDFIFDVIAGPIGKAGTGIIGSYVNVFATTTLWSVGINANGMINSIYRPFWLVNNQENIIAAAQGADVLPHVITEQFFDMVWMGGGGVTLGLLIAMIISAKSKQNKTMSKLAIVPGVFNINEPILFGLPVILNPIMLIPFNLVPLVMVTTQYIAMSLNIVARPAGIIIPWTTPPILSGFLVTGHISGAVMQLVNLIIAALIYLPFIKMLDKQHLKEEK
ncbi:MAG: PTS sugar transporter subunit IIC [Mycoplasmatales bacterium]